MINRTQIKQYLSANGVSMDSSDEEIKSLLFSAKWHESDVDTALTVLRENTQTHEQKVDSLHRVFHTDDRLQPETISALLGIDVDIPPREELSRATRGSVGVSEFGVIAVFALVFASIFFGFMCWVLEIGPFYPGSSL